MKEINPAPEYDFTLGRHRLRGSGWRGLTALGILCGTIVIIILFSTPAAGAWLLQMMHLLGI